MLELAKLATIDPTGRFRYRLERHWDSSRPSICWVLLNPSTADACQDDPTVRRIVAFSKTWGYGAAIVVNLFALRATSPAVLRAATERIGPDNDRHILTAVSAAAATVIAWGCHGSLANRNLSVLTDLKCWNIPILCLGLTAEGHPKHPLYLPDNTTPQSYSELSERHTLQGARP